MPDTEASELAKKYLALGGRRKQAADDNAISTRLWEDEPQAAAAFWRDSIETLGKDRRREVETFLPSISGDSR